MDQATKPNYFLPIEHLKKDIPEEKLEEAVELREEAVLASLADHEGWQLFKNITENTLNSLANFNKEQIANGVSLEEIGRNALLDGLCREVINGLINKVEDAKESQRQDK